MTANFLAHQNNQIIKSEKNNDTIETETNGRRDFPFFHTHVTCLKVIASAMRLI